MGLRVVEHSGLRVEALGSPGFGAGLGPLGLCGLPCLFGEDEF